MRPMNNTKKEAKNSNRLKLASHPKQGLKALAYKIFLETFYGKKSNLFIFLQFYVFIIKIVLKLS